MIGHGVSIAHARGEHQRLAPADCRGRWAYAAGKSVHPTSSFFSEKTQNRPCITKVAKTQNRPCITKGVRCNTAVMDKLTPANPVTSFRIPVALLSWLRDAAAGRGVPMSVIMIEALECKRDGVNIQLTYENKYPMPPGVKFT
jgi:hypothetical protein